MWACHFVRMDEGWLSKKAEAMKLLGRRKRGRPQLRWEDCVKRDVRKAGEDDKWRETAAEREVAAETEKGAGRDSWKGETAGSVQQYMN